MGPSLSCDASTGSSRGMAGSGGSRVITDRSPGNYPCRGFRLTRVFGWMRQIPISARIAKHSCRGGRANHKSIPSQNEPHPSAPRRSYARLRGRSARAAGGGGGENACCVCLRVRLEHNGTGGLGRCAGTIPGAQMRTAVGTTQAGGHRGSRQWRALFHRIDQLMEAQVEENG